MDAITSSRAGAAQAAGARHAAIATQASRAPRTWTAARLLPLIGRWRCTSWDLVVRLQLVSPVLLLTPGATLVALAKGMAGGPLLGDFSPRSTGRCRHSSSPA